MYLYKKLKTKFVIKYLSIITIILSLGLSLNAQNSNSKPSATDHQGVGPLIQGMLLENGGEKRGSNFTEEVDAKNNAHYIIDNAFNFSIPAGDPNIPCLVIRYDGGERARSYTLYYDTASISIRTRAQATSQIIPLSSFKKTPSKFELVAPVDNKITAFYITMLNPREAQTVDIGIILHAQPLPPANDYMLYTWNILPSVIIFDFRNYTVQDAYFKRLAFFVEKPQYKGRLATNEQIAKLHGWNAHDYRPIDLANYFNAVRQQKFTLNPEEENFRNILLDRGIIINTKTGYTAGLGAVISVTQESDFYLRAIFLAHEPFHAVFFIDNDYRTYTKSIWDSMSKEEKWFYYRYFEMMNYDTNNPYLVLTEFQSYLLQQPVASVTKYFTETLPQRLIQLHPELTQPIQSYMGKYKNNFAMRASQLEKWLDNKYGMMGGRSSFLLF